MKSKKIIYIILVCIIAVGAVVTGFKGLNFDLKYTANKQIEINIGKQFDVNDVKQIAKEVIGNKEIIVQKVEIYEEIVSITAQEITNEQVEEINTKVNEKYGIKNEVKDLIVTENAHIKGRDLIKQFIFPIALSLVIILIYATIRFRKINIFEVLAKIIGLNILAELLYVSIIAITRLQVNGLTVPAAIAIYVIVTIAIFNEFEHKEEKIKKEQKNK